MAFSIFNQSAVEQNGINELTIEFKMNEPREDHWVKEGFRAVYDCATQNVKSEGTVGIELSVDWSQSHGNKAKCFQVRSLTSIPPSNLDVLNLEHVWELMNQHYSECFSPRDRLPTGDDLFKIVITYFEPEQGESRDENLPEQDNISDSNMDGLIKPEPEEPSNEEDELSECVKCDRVFPKTGRDKCDKCYIMGGENKKNFIPFSSHSWDSYEDFKAWQYKYDRRRVNCKVCGKEMGRTAIYRHMTNIHHQ